MYSDYIDNISLEKTKNIIYYIRNNINNKIYIGKTERTFFDRYPGGKWWKITKNRFLLADYKKHGAENFEFEILSVIDPKENILAHESYFIGLFQTIYPDGYNLSIDLSMHEDKEIAGVYFAGIVGKRAGMKNPDEVISKSELSEHMAKIRPEHIKEKVKKAVSKAQKGKIISPENRKAVSERFKGKKLKPAHLEKIIKLATERQGKPILQINPETKEVVAEYKSIMEATRAIKACKGTIGSALNGRYKTSCGFEWRFKNEVT